MRFDLYTIESLPQEDRDWLIAEGWDLSAVTGVTITDDGTERHIHLELSTCESCGSDNV